MINHNYPASRVKSEPEYFHETMYYKVSELVSGKTLISDDYKFSTKMSLYERCFHATIKSGTLPGGFSYKIEFYSLIDEEVIEFKESFVFKVV